MRNRCDSISDPAETDHIMEVFMKKIAIGGGQGFWGDSPDAALHMLRHADIQKTQKTLFV